MADIILTTLNARFAHCSLGLRYLMANLGELKDRARILEFEISLRTAEIVERILVLNPRIVGIGVYVWSAEESARLAAELKRLRPELVIVLGGPEISHETREQRIFSDADFVITGEGELAFAQLCRQVLSGNPPAEKVIEASVPDLGSLALPYELYSDEDVANRVIYVEASRGCPFACDFCLSALDRSVRVFPLERLFAEWTKLLKRGARRFKFTDRTFNLNPEDAGAVLEFFLARIGQGLSLHFEVVPDRFPEEIFALIKRFPPGTLQLEIGIQTFNEEAAARINRRQDNAAAEMNIRRLRRETSAYLHADLIVGLPGEDLASFAAGFDRLRALEPHEIQVGILKRLRGAPIVRHDAEWGMVYSPYPPYELRENKAMDFFTMQRLRRLARYWDLVANSGVFAETALLVCGGESAFYGFLGFSDWLYERTGQTHEISRSRLRELLRVYLTDVMGHSAEVADAVTERDAKNASRSSKTPGSERQSMHATQQ